MCGGVGGGGGEKIFVCASLSRAEAAEWLVLPTSDQGPWFEFR